MHESVLDVLVRTGQLHGWVDDPAEIIKALDRHFRMLDEPGEREAYHPNMFVPP
jgi:hypothetical protein